MQDRQTEQFYHPREMLSLEGITSVLCIAPHPDDEVLGCGGLLALLRARQAQVQVLVLTQGELGQAQLQAQSPTNRQTTENQTSNSQTLAQIRVQESQAAAQVLGLAQPKFLQFKDRHLGFTEVVTQAIQAQIQSQNQVQPINLLLLPSLSDPHPDHQATSLAGLAAVQTILSQAPTHPLQVLFYEVGAPLHANAYVDITSVANQKWAAVQCFTSQLTEQKYESLSRAMAAMRAFGLQPECTAAEAFFKVDMAAFLRNGALAAIPQWPWVRHSFGLANAPEQMPLVSVLVRSMDRNCLAQALASVVLQSYANIELVVVNAKGGMHSQLSYLPQTLPFTLLNAQASSQALSRSQATNMALQHAKGALAIFLDDDDLFKPNHLSQLVQLLQDNAEAVGAYAGVSVEDSQGNTLRQYNLPWSRQRLLAINYLPIHAVLFKMDVVKTQGLGFNPALDVLEDWHFWLQLTQKSKLVHNPHITAVYRQALGKSELGNASSQSHWQSAHHQILEQFVLQAASQELADVLSWHAIALDTQVLQIEKLQAQAALDHAQLAQELAARLALQQELEIFSNHAQQIFDAKENQLQAIAAETQKVLDAKENQLQAIAAETQKVLDAKELEKQYLAKEVATLRQSFVQVIAFKMASWVRRFFSSRKA